MRVSAAETTRVGRAEPAKTTVAGRMASPEVKAAVGSTVMILFIIALISPIYFNIGTLRLNLHRVILLIAFVPLFFQLVSGKAGGVRAADVFFFLYSAWIGVALFVVHGTIQIPFIGITIVEILGGYMLGRVYIRSPADYRLFFKYFAWALLFLLPFVLFEQMTRRPLLNEILGSAFEVIRYTDRPQRNGMNRVQGSFEHPILFGLFCALAVTNFWYLFRDNLAKRLSLTGLAIFMTLMSMSSAPLLSVITQLGMIVWEKISKANWKLLGVLSVIGYVVIDLLSNRTPVQVLISYATLNPATAANRLHIWTWGTQNVAANPIFGIGLNDWFRAPWMVSGSVDNFWLLTAMRYGLPAVIFLIIAVLANLSGIMRRKGLSEDERTCRTAYFVASIGLFLTLGTVHVWGSTAVLVSFFIGAGAWMATAGHAPGAEADGDAPETRGPARRAPRERDADRSKPASAPAVETRADPRRPVALPLTRGPRR